MQGSPTEAAQRAQGLQPGGNIGRAVGMQSPRASVVTGVEGVQQLNHLGAPTLSHHDAIRPHPQGLSHHVAERYGSNTVGVIVSCLQRHDMGMRAAQLVGVLYYDNPLPTGQFT
jgi:hypothetical protein